jgi:hypothetical protein
MSAQKEINIEEFASEVAVILKRRLDTADLMKLMEIVFLDVDEAAALFKVESKTVRSWVQQGVIPYRRAHGKIIFLLAELLAWTLPDDDPHSRYRLVSAQQCTLAADKLASSIERRSRI